MKAVEEEEEKIEQEEDDSRDSKTAEKIKEEDKQLLQQ